MVKVISKRINQVFFWVTTLKRLLVIQLVLLTITNLLSAPAWDEWGHLPSGLYHIQFSEYRPYQVNPPLIRTIAAIPVWLVGGGYDCYAPVTEIARRSEGVLAQKFFNQHGLWTFVYFWIARQVLLFFPLFGTYLIYSIAKDNLGQTSARIAASLWVFSPLVLAFGSLMVPDIPMTVLGLWATKRFMVWLDNRTINHVTIAAVVLGLALLSKSTWIILPIFFLAILLFHNLFISRSHTWRRDMHQLFLFSIISWLVLHAGYEFQGIGKPLGCFRFYSDTLKGSCQAEGESIVGNPPPLSSGNRFQNTLIGRLPCPIPAAYLEGIDLQKLDFDQGFDSYLLGIRKNGGWWYYYLVGLFLKQSIFLWLVLLLALFAGATQFRKRGSNTFIHNRRWLILLFLPGCSVLILVSSQTGFNHHLRYAFPILPVLFLTAAMSGARCTRSLGIPLALLYAVSGLSSMPRPYAFFSEAVGGSYYGWKYMDNSNLDWGQDAFTAFYWIATNLEKQPFYMLYSITPAKIGDQGLPVLDGRKHLLMTDDGKYKPITNGYWIVFAQSLTLPEGEWFRDRIPIQTLSPTIRIYKVSQGDIVRGASAPKDSNRNRPEEHR